MQSLLEKSLQRAMHSITELAALIGPHNVDESTFRSHLLAEIMRHESKAVCQKEWHGFDVLVRVGAASALLEIKFYFANARTMELDGRLGDWKGGPGSQNEQEFVECLEKLRSARHAVAQKFLILVYRCGAIKATSPLSYDKSYADLSRFGTSVVNIIDHCDAVNVTCKMINID